MDFSARADLPEWMDTPGLNETTYRRCLADLAAVNRVTLTHNAALSWLDRATHRLPSGTKIVILDVACGQGDLLRRIARWAGRRGFQVQLSGIDINPRSAAAAVAATPAGSTIEYHTSDVFTFMPAARPDFIVTSQFTHHLANADILRLLRWLETHAVRGWHISDLHRHPFAYYGFPLLARLTHWHPIVRNDGTISIARSFTRQDWEALLCQDGITAKITWRIPFRYSVSRLK